MKKKPVIRKISIKIVLMLVGIIVGLNVAATFLVTLILRGYIHIMGTEKFYMYMGYVTFFISVLGLIVFAVLVHRVFVKRIQALQKAMNQVTGGNYNVIVPQKDGDELDSLTDSFNKMMEELKANEFLSMEFTRNVSHEFKTPLSVMRGYAELISEESSDESIKNSAEIIMSESDRLSELSKTLIEISALNSTTIIKQEDTFSPATQIRTILQATQLLWEGKNLELDLDLQDFQIVGNEKLLYRVWQNLIGNAIKFSNDGGVIHIAVTRNNDSCVFEVADNGAGITDENKEKIYNQFFVGDISRNIEGSGLGLPLARKIVEKMNGKIYFESHRNEGTKFIVDIPLSNKP